MPTPRSKLASFGSLLLLLLLLAPMPSLAQPRQIRSMSWDREYQLQVQLADDSTYVVDVRGLYHQGAWRPDQEQVEGTTFLPVNFDPEFIAYLKAHPLTDTPPDTPRPARTSNATLWSALSAHLGGGYVHLINCLIYALENGTIHLECPIMLRPKTKWKPSPMTPTYRRTRRWEYYVPTTQRQAKKEYKLRKKEEALQDLQGIPRRFLELFLATSDREYRRMREDNKADLVAQIDLVRLLLGAKYLGEKQIAYIGDGVKQAVAQYSAHNLPSVIIFDDFNAAVAMRLDQQGYQVDYIVFQAQEAIPDQELQKRRNKIYTLVSNINAANTALFRRRLSQHYE